MPAERHFRAFARRAVTLPVTISTEGGSARSAKLVNLGLGGACVAVSDKTEPGRVVTLEVNAPNLWDPLVVVAKVIPFTNAAQYNAMIPGVVDPRVAQGKHIIIVDCFTNFPAGGMDFVHPYQSGYNWMGDRFYESVSSLLPR